MKTYYLLTMAFCIGVAKAQTPYDKFAPEQNKKQMLEGERLDSYIILNADTTSCVKFIEYDAVNQVIAVYSDQDILTEIIEYDPLDKKWLSVDPKASKYPSHSPYNAFTNNPIMLVDPDGQEIVDAQHRRVDYTVSKKGKVEFQFAEGTTDAEKKEFEKTSGRVIKAMLKVSNGKELVEQVQASTDKFLFGINNESTPDNRSNDAFSLGGEFSMGDIIVPTTADGKRREAIPGGELIHTPVVQILVDVEGIQNNMKSKNNCSDVANNMQNNSVDKNIGIVAFAYVNFLLNKNGESKIIDLYNTKDKSERRTKTDKINDEVQKAVPSF